MEQWLLRKIRADNLRREAVANFIGGKDSVRYGGITDPFRIIDDEVYSYGTLIARRYRTKLNTLDGPNWGILITARYYSKTTEAHKDRLRRHQDLRYQDWRGVFTVPEITIESDKGHRDNMRSFRDYYLTDEFRRKLLRARSPQTIASIMYDIGQCSDRFEYYRFLFRPKSPPRWKLPLWLDLYAKWYEHLRQTRGEADPKTLKKLIKPYVD